MSKDFTKITGKENRDFSLLGMFSSLKLELSTISE